MRTRSFSFGAASAPKARPGVAAERGRAEGDGGVEEIATLQAHRWLRQKRLRW
jgi:hypothetical protein